MTLDAKDYIKDCLFTNLNEVTNLNVALAYARMGWDVFPLHTPANGGCSCRNLHCRWIGKHPRTMNGFHDATTDENKIREWWEIWPHANIGIVTGSNSGLIILDIDPRHDGDRSLAYLEEEYDKLPETLKVTTGGDGSHYYFRHPGFRCGNSSSRVARGVDIRGDGGYIVAPPSLHESGKHYHWDNNLEISDAPEWLLKLLKETRRSEPDSFADENGRVTEGKRNDFLFSRAWPMRRYGYLGELEIRAALASLNQERCEPPLPAEEVAKIAKSAASYNPADEFESYTNNDDVGEEQTRSESANKATDPVTRLLARVVSARELNARQFPQQEWVIPGVLLKGTATVLAGTSKVGKSFMSLGTAVAVASGGRAFGQIPVKRRKVIYLGLEDGERRIQSRLRNICGGELPDGLLIVDEWLPLDKGGLEALERLHDANPDVEYIIIDTSPRIQPAAARNRSAYENDYRALAPLNDFAHRRNVAVLLICHTNQLTDYTDWFTKIMGTTGVTASVDNLMLLDRQRGSVDATLRVAGRDMEEKELDMRLDLTTCCWILRGDSMSTLAKRVLSWLQESTTGLSASDLNKKNGNRGVRDALIELESFGRVVKVEVKTGGRPREVWRVAESIRRQESELDRNINHQTTARASAYDGDSVCGSFDDKYDQSQNAWNMGKKGCDQSYDLSPECGDESIVAEKAGNFDRKDHQDRSAPVTKRHYNGEPCFADICQVQHITEVEYWRKRTLNNMARFKAASEVESIPLLPDMWEAEGAPLYGHSAAEQFCVAELER